MKNLSIVAFLLYSLPIFAQSPKELVVAIGHTQMSTKSQPIDKPLQAYLSKKLGMPIKVIYPKDIFEMLEKIDSSQVHVADINPFGYVMASLNDKVDVVAVRGNKEGKLETYNSCLIVYRSSPIKKIQDLKKMGSKMEMAFVNAASTSGHLVPRLYFNAIKLDVETVFKTVSFQGTHAQVAEYLLGKPNVVGACSFSLIENMFETGKLKKEDFRIIWTSPQIPHGPVAYLKSLDASLKTKIQQAYLAIPTEAPELWNSMLANWNAKPESTTYIKGSDSFFDSLRKITNEAEDLILVLNFYR